MKRPRTSGFTLTELMVVLAIIAILAAFGYPAYTDSVRKARRADAKAALMENAQWMERNYTEANRYDKDAAGNSITSSKLPYQSAPRDSNVTFYTISFEGTGPGQQSYTLQAVPQGDQANDSCGTLTLTHTGKKGVSKGTVADCW